MKAFGQRLAYLRSKAKLSQAELAEKLNIAKSTLGMYETNQREPSFDITDRIADYFEVTIDYLLGRDLTARETLSHADHEQHSIMRGIGDKQLEYEKENKITEYLVRELIEKYKLELSIPGEKEKLEQFIKLYSETRKK